MHCDQRQPHPHAGQKRARTGAGADDDGLAGHRDTVVERHDRRGAGTQGVYGGVETEAGAQSLCLGLQQLRELSAVASAVLGQMHGRMQRCAFVQARLQFAAARGVDDLVRPAPVAQQCQACLCGFQVVLAAQQHQGTASLLELELQAAREFFHAHGAQLRQPVHGRAIGAVHARAASPPPPPQPGQLRQGVQAARPQPRGATQELARHAPWHAGRSQRSDESG
jgi:hypothetical protein